MSAFEALKKWLVPVAVNGLGSYEPTRLNALLDRMTHRGSKLVNAITSAIIDADYQMTTFGQLNPLATQEQITEILSALKKVELTDWHLGDHYGRSSTTDRFGAHQHRDVMISSSNQKLFHFTGYVHKSLVPISSYYLKLSPPQMLAISMRLRDAATWVETHQQNPGTYNSECFITSAELTLIRDLIPQIPYRTCDERDGGDEQRQGIFLCYKQRDWNHPICQMHYECSEDVRCAMSTYLASITPKNIEAVLNSISFYERQIADILQKEQLSLKQLSHQEQSH
jgi:hypothetical protein